MEGRAWSPLNWAPLLPQQRQFPGGGIKTCSILTQLQQGEEGLRWMRLLPHTDSVSLFTASPGPGRRQKSCYEHLYFHLASFLTHSHKNLLHMMSYQKDVNLPGHLSVQYLLCFLSSFLVPWCLSTSYQFNLDYKGSSNSELKYIDLRHLQSVREADTGTCNLIYCFPPSLLMKFSSKLLHATPCSSRLKVNYLQKNCHISPAPTSIRSMTLTSKDSIHPFSTL